jgi:hypothetical protein
MEGNEITEEILHKNYILNWDSSHFVDLDADAWLVNFLDMKISNWPY